MSHEYSQLAQTHSQPNRVFTRQASLVSDCSAIPLIERRRSTITRASQDEETLDEATWSTTQLTSRVTNKPSLLKRFASWDYGVTGFRKRRSGWRSGVLFSACTAAACCVVNTALLIWLSTIGSPENGIGTAFEGSCSKVKNLALASHLIINTLGSVLLAASNYCMQCLAAPTREECDRAHRNNDFLDIGINSVRNISKLRGMRICLWTILALTSFPIHILYNSVVFSVLSANTFSMWSVNPAFLPYEDDWTNSTYCGVYTKSNNHTLSPNDQYGFASYTSYVDFMEEIYNTCNVTECFPSDRVSTNQSHTSSTIAVLSDECQLETTCLIRYTNDTALPLETSNKISQVVSLWDSCPLSDCSLVTSSNTTVAGLELLVVQQPTYRQEPTYQEIALTCAQAASTNQGKVWVSDGNTTVPQGLYQKNKAAFVNMSLADCVSTYTQTFVTEWGNVFVVSDVLSSNPSIPDVPFVFRGTNSASWSGINTKAFCNQVTVPGQCTQQALLQNANNLTHDGRKLEYCLAERMAPRGCTLQYSSTMFIVVILCNAVKAVCMLLTLYYKKDTPLMISGDAIASFLQRPDLHTKDQCLTTGAEVRARQAQERRAGIKVAPPAPELVDFTVQMKRPLLARAISRSQIVFAVIFIGTFLGVSMGLLGLAASSAASLMDNASSAWSLGLGAVVPQLTIGDFTSQGTSGFLGNVIVSNSPQFLFSCAYVIYNNLLTVMLQHKEWSTYAVKPRALRVSRPEGQQRSTYFLNLPYKYGLPLLVTSATLHWMISASIFLVQVNYFYEDAEQPSLRLYTLGYSPLAILVAVLVGVVMLLAIAALACTRSPSAMPVASSNSFAIAASCHPPPGDGDAATRMVQWGEPKESLLRNVGHCSFSSQATVGLEPGRLYQ